MKKKSDKEKQKKIATERVSILFKKAEEIFAKSTTKANRYVTLARRIAMKMNLRLKKEEKLKFCKHCYSYILSGVNAVTRTRDRKLIIYCKICKKYTRIPLNKKPLKK